MVLNQAGLANIRYNNTKEHNLVTIKRFNRIRKSLIHKIQPFISNYVISIKETYFKNNNLVVIYKQINVLL
jgi:hypothetical protein